MFKGMVRAAALLLALNSLPAHADSCVWYSHDDSIRQVRTSTNEVTHVVALRSPHRLVMNAEDCGVWTLDKRDRRLLRFSAEGVLEREIRVRDLEPRLDDVERLHIDPYDASLWVTDERRISHISAAGSLLGSFSTPGSIRRMRVALDQTLWILGKRDLWHFDATGNLLTSFALRRHLAGDARFFAIDSVAGLIWLADDNDIAQLKLVNPTEPPLRIRLSREVTGFALDPYSGKVWVAQKETLLAFSRDGALAHSVNLEALNIRKPEKLAFDPVSRSLWAGAERSVSRFSDTGQFVVRLDARDGDEALGVPAFKVQPTLTLILPPQNALANNPRPELRLGYGADCNGVACGFSGSYFSNYRLSATLNTQQIGGTFLFNLDSTEASYTPPARLPEGANSFTAQVTDAFEHKSNAISNSFTIDTIVPRFLTLSPVDGSVFQIPQAILQGTIDDPQATVVLDALGLSQAGANFAFPVTLRPGPNIFTLSAIDRAANRASAQRTLSFVPLALSIASPAGGALISGSNILVTGTMQGPPNTGVTVNGVVAVIAADRFYATVPLQTGANFVAVIAKTQDGFSVQQTVSVTGTGAAPIEVSATPQSGLAPLKVDFTVAITANVSVRKIEADFDGNGTIDLTTTNPSARIEFTYAQPGVYPARLVVTDGQGNTTVQVLQIVVQDSNALDQQLKAAWAGFAVALASKNLQGASQYLSDNAKEVYAPMLEALKDQLPAIVPSFSDLRTFTVTSSLAEYAMRRTEPNGKTYLYLIYFQQGSDGVWRLEAM